MGNFMCATVAEGVSGQRAFVQLWNPADSGQNLEVTQMILAHSYNGASGFDLRQHAAALGSKKVNPPNKAIGGTPSIAELRSGNVAPASIPGAIIQEEWIGRQFDDHTYRFDPPIVIHPGLGIHATAAHDGTYLVASFEFSEVAA